MDLRALEPVPPRLVHGDLGPVHVLLEGGRPTGLLDFGYVSTVGDPAFDAAVAACLQDMFGPGAAAATAALDEATTTRFGYDPAVLVLYRAAYGLVTASCLAGHPGPPPRLVPGPGRDLVARHRQPRWMPANEPIR